MVLFRKKVIDKLNNIFDHEFLKDMHGFNGVDNVPIAKAMKNRGNK